MEDNNIKRIFIVGCGHSGTSILLRILGEHRMVYAVPEETGIFINTDMSETKIIKNRLCNLDILARQNNKVLWAEKTPKHIKCIKKILSINPKSKIIAITRDPRDVACSMKNRGYTFQDGLKRWIEDNTCLLEEKSNKKIYIIKLEDLIKNPEENIKKLLCFLELPDQNLLSYYLNKQDWYSKKVIETKPENSLKENHKIFRNWQINQPLFKDTKRYDKEMTVNDKKIFKEHFLEILPLADQLGYEI